ncbi:photo-regulated tyrosinase [Gloeopeniophorella convolvens]|nr:photo-regulated tyrosinase [Gloeopeniophorella convolvens]
MSHLVINGAQGGNTQGADAPNRIEINDFVKIEDQFSLYIQALRATFDASQTDPISFFQIGGIHGLPYTQWEGAGSTHPVKGSQWGGYCTHGSVLFPTWHRPYLALYEQVLQQHALDIAKTYKVDQQRWLSAAQNLRAPYWDWATNTVPPPEVISLSTVDIITPDGETTAVPNPLLQYTFHPIDKSFPSPYSHWKTTLRHPDNNSPNATTDVRALIEQMRSVQEDITSSTYNLLTRVRTWPAFSNHTPGDGGSSSNSLEAIHDEIHVSIGGRGQIGDPALAGFDPIFFLLHANVDRLLSLWSAVNPGVWVTRGPAEGGTWTIPSNANIDANTNLTPFWDSRTGFWASAETTKTSKLGYSYPEFNGLDLSNTSAVQAAIAKYINQQYGGSSAFISFAAAPPATLAAQPAAGPDSTAKLAAGAGSAAASVSHPFASRGGAAQAATQSPQTQSASNSIQDWTARICFKKYELGGSFAVLLFLGEVPTDAALWRTSPNFVGSHYAFVNSAAEQCANCREQADVESEGFVHLNAAIARLSGLSSFEPGVVGPYLKESLHWRIQAVDRTVVEASRLPSLEVTVSSTRLTEEPGAHFPIAGDPHYHRDITHGRQGGARTAQA